MKINHHFMTFRQLCDLEMILNGSYNPLLTFMNEEDYYSVVSNLELANGDFFPIPIVLDLSEKEASNMEIGDQLVLTDSENLPIASMSITSIYKPDLRNECLKVLGTDDLNHPYAKFLLDRNYTTYYISGPLVQLNPIIHYDFKTLRKNPDDIKNMFKNNNWSTVIGFQTRNPIHRCHYEMTLYMMNQLSTLTGNDVKLLITPTVGISQECDIDYYTRVQCYLSILHKYPVNSVELCLLPLSMKMAGPREALLHAIVRKNYGCTHFIIGRDHAGPSYKPSDTSKNSFYEPYAAHELAVKYHDKLGINILLMNEMVYISNKNQYIPIDQLLPTDQCENISGTKLRKMLESNQIIPDWYTFPEISNILRNNVKTPQHTGICIYFIGLSGSGKSTLVKCLRNQLMEYDLYNRKITILDADEIRQNLSKGLGFSAEDRSTNVRRIGYVASLIVKHGGICLVANIAPYENDREYNKTLIKNDGFYYQVYVNTPLDKCKERDCKGLYQKASQNLIKLTGVNDPFEIPKLNDLEIASNTLIDLELANNKIINSLLDNGYISKFR